jgi:hypothetical protein
LTSGVISPHGEIGVRVAALASSGTCLCSVIQLPVNEQGLSSVTVDTGREVCAPTVQEGSVWGRGTGNHSLTLNPNCILQPSFPMIRC